MQWPGMDRSTADAAPGLHDSVNTRYWTTDELRLRGGFAKATAATGAVLSVIAFGSYSGQGEGIVTYGATGTVESHTL